MKVSWHKFDGVEAQVFEPDAGSNEVVLLCPGFPGLGATMFEQRHAAAFVKEGYAVYVIKHKGTRLNLPMSPVMVNNAARLMEGRANGDTHLGGGPATIDEWMVEPYKALKVLHAAYDTLHVIGNSFGALSALWSLSEKDAPVSKIKTLLLWAGAQGVDDGTENSIMRLWQPAFLMDARITDKVTLNDPFQLVETLREAYAALPERTKNLPEHIALTSLVIERDEILRLSDAQAFQAAIGGRGKIVVNSEEKGFMEHALMAHDSPMLKTEDLLELIR